MESFDLDGIFDAGIAMDKIILASEGRNLSG